MRRQHLRHALTRLLEHHWTERGLLVRELDDGELEREDLWHKNRLVERTLHRDPTVRVLWPFPDRTGLIHPALRAQARLVFSGEQLIEADFSPWQTDRPLPDDWVDSLAELATICTLSLRGAAPREDDIFRAVRALPSLTNLQLGAGVLSRDAVARLRRERPSLAVR